MRKKEEMKAKKRRIDELLKNLPREEKRKMEIEERRQEGIILKEIEENIWKKWRGKVEKKEMSTKSTPGEDLDMRMAKIQQRLEEIKEEERKKKILKDKKKKLEEHWEMLRWLTKYIKENRYSWEKRREIERDEKEMNDIYDEWMSKTREEQIEGLKNEKEEELEKERMRNRKIEKAQARKTYWKTWRNNENEKVENEMPKKKIKEKEQKLRE